MKAIISDIHANLEAFRAVLADIEAQGASEIICLGDFVGYGPNPKECIDEALGFDIALRGNHEEALMTEFQASNFNVKARKSIDWTREQLSPLSEDREANLDRWDFLDTLEMVHRSGNVCYVHGSVREPTSEYLYPRDIYKPGKLGTILEEIDWLCFCGHTHLPGIWTQDMIFLSPQEVNYRYQLVNKKTIVNVGSVGQPRDGDPRAGYVLFDGNRVIFRRVQYPVETTVRKIRQLEEVDDYLAERLLDGR